MTDVVDYRRPAKSSPPGRVHLVDPESGLTRCGGLEARLWPTVRKPGSTDELCRNCAGVVERDGWPAWAPTGWLAEQTVASRRRASSTYTRETHVSCDRGETTLCRVEKSWPTLELETVGTRRPLSDLDPSCENCSELVSRSIVR